MARSLPGHGSRLKILELASKKKCLHICSLAYSVWAYSVWAYGVCMAKCTIITCLFPGVGAQAAIIHPE